jgi:acyl dehydratase
VHLNELTGYDLGSKVATYTARDAILYALAVGAPATQLDLVYERDLRVLPSYACVLGLWAVEAAGALRAYDRERSLHASQTLTMRRPLPREGRIDMHGKVNAVWDKGKATIVEIAVEAEVFTADYTVFLPGIGNWGGAPGPATAAVGTGSAFTLSCAAYSTSPEQAALYRLTGDLHPIHIDPIVAKANGFDRPILHGLCTLGIAARLIAGAAGAHPCDLKSLSARLSAPVMPGETIAVSAQGAKDALSFEATSAERVVLKSGQAAFA